MPATDRKLKAYDVQSPARNRHPTHTRTPSKRNGLMLPLRRFIDHLGSSHSHAGARERRRSLWLARGRALERTKWVIRNENGRLRWNLIGFKDMIVRCKSRCLGNAGRGMKQNEYGPENKGTPSSTPAEYPRVIRSDLGSLRLGLPWSSGGYPAR